jgi:hypothetical protein
MLQDFGFLFFFLALWQLFEILIHLHNDTGYCEWKASGTACQIHEIQGWVHDILWPTC